MGSSSTRCWDAKGQPVQVGRAGLHDIICGMQVARWMDMCVQ